MATFSADHQNIHSNSKVAGENLSNIFYNFLMLKTSYLVTEGALWNIVDMSRVPFEWSGRVLAKVMTFCSHWKQQDPLNFMFFNFFYYYFLINFAPFASVHHFEKWQSTIKLSQQEQEHGDDENYFPNECWALMLSCGFSSEVGLPLRGKRRWCEGGGREGEGGDGGREEDELYWRWWWVGEMGQDRENIRHNFFFHSKDLPSRSRIGNLSMCQLDVDDN